MTPEEAKTWERLPLIRREFIQWSRDRSRLVRSLRGLPSELYEMEGRWHTSTREIIGLIDFLLSRRIDIQRCEQDASNKLSQAEYGRRVNKEVSERIAGLEDKLAGQLKETSQLRQELLRQKEESCQQADSYIAMLQEEVGAALSRKQTLETLINTVQQEVNQQHYKMQSISRRDQELASGILEQAKYHSALLNQVAEMAKLKQSASEHEAKLRQDIEQYKYRRKRLDKERSHLSRQWNELEILAMNIGRKTGIKYQVEAPIHAS